MTIYRLKSGDAAKIQQLSLLFKNVFEMEPQEPASEFYGEQILKNFLQL